MEEPQYKQTKKIGKEVMIRHQDGSVKSPFAKGGGSLLINSK
jgi:hypothetical protein